MKQDMYYTALDLEMNQPSGKLIQIGLVLGAPGLPEHQWDIRKWYVDPDEPITEYITNLTGITNQDIRDYAKPAEEIFSDIRTFLNSYRMAFSMIRNPVVWGHGDDKELREYFAEHDLEFTDFGHRNIDTKTIHQFKQFAVGRNQNGGLKSAMGSYKMQFKGEPHRADIDAFNTLRLYFMMLKEQSELAAAQKIMTNLVSPVHKDQ